MKKSITLVVPTIRENCLKDFIDRWKDVGLFNEIENFIIMEDNPKRTFETPKELGCRVYHLCWDDIDRLLSTDAEIIPRRSDTVRSFAYWFAWKFCTTEYTMTLDDDCYPDTSMQQSLVDLHMKAMQDRGRWFNTLTNGRPRGFPYKNTGKTEVVINHGLWTNVLDMDAPTQLVAPFSDDHGLSRGQLKSEMVPNGMYFPFCGMNVCWKTKYTVLMYHLLMGKKAVGDTLKKYPYDRFGDIWCGIIAKKICDLFGLGMTTGFPLIKHDRASDPFTNLVKEAEGIKVNEEFWKIIDCFNPSDDEYLGTKESLIAEYYSLMGFYINDNSTSFSKEHYEYFSELGLAMHRWSKLFR